MKIPVFVVDQEGVLTDVFLTDRRPTVRSLDGQGEGRAASQTEHQVSRFSNAAALVIASGTLSMPVNL
jgi:hypothetical protein